MEAKEFDATLGGTEHLPDSANSLKFAASRSVEIAAMTESILRPSKTKLIFQTLPVHMRRRVMSHNCKRLPRKLREGHMEQLKKSGLPPKQKRPSRKYRRRPANLMEEYNRRQKQFKWLETHIWHAKRFHMIQRWGYKLAHAPCDKAFRACYRASSAHCLIQDISYYTPIQISGSVESIKGLFSSITSCSCGLSICARAFTTGNRSGTINLYKPNWFPLHFIGKIEFIWVPTDNPYKTVWLFVHPSQVKLVESVLNNILQETATNSNSGPAEKKRKLEHTNLGDVSLKVLSSAFNRFRLTGPNSHAVLIKSLKCIDSMNLIKHDEWITQISEKESHLDIKQKYWQMVSSVSSPSQLPARIIVGLIVRDPRLQRPSYRTKAKAPSSDEIDASSLLRIPPQISASPLWDTSLHETIKKKMLTNTQFIEHITKTQVVPGEVNQEDPALQSVPVVLIQRPGSQEDKIKKIGYGSGWDIIVPNGYGIQFWHTFIMFGARSGGLRETESLAFEMAESFMPPDSEAGKTEEKRIEMEMKEKYFRLPPSKRVNYIKLAINSPFVCHWKTLLTDWGNRTTEDFYVLRSKELLNSIESCIENKKELPKPLGNPSCLVPVYIKMLGRGNLKRHSLICLPEQGDLNSLKTLFEPHHEDHNEKIRKQTRSEHIKLMKTLRKKRYKVNKSGTKIATPKTTIKGPSEYVKIMRELWLPPSATTVRNSCSRQVLGYITNGAFSFTEARSCGIGYMAYNALDALVKSGQTQVLVRNTSSRKYWAASLHINKNV